MFDVLAYLVENYVGEEDCPDPDTLELKLKAAGFEGEDIGAALDWLSGLAASEAAELPLAFAARHSFRSFVPAEEKQLSRECRGLLAFLESSGAIDPRRRELIIERALALPHGSVDVEQLKIICLVVLWSAGARPDALILDELLPDGEPRELH